MKINKGDSVALLVIIQGKIQNLNIEASGPYSFKKAKEELKHAENPVGIIFEDCLYIQSIYFPTPGWTKKMYLNYVTRMLRGMNINFTKTEELK